MHASELAGSSVALAIAEDFLAVHVDPARLDLSPAVLARLREVRLFVLPRMSPDGAEAVLTTGRFVRSVPRDDRAERGASRWRTGDIDGDGLSLVMRVADPTGDYVAPARRPPRPLVGPPARR
jgi:murein tripeptide amidase MpaA